MIFTTARNGCWESASIAAGFTPLLQLVCRKRGCTPSSAWLWNDEDGRCSSSLGFHEVSSVENTTFRLRVAPTFLCWGFPSGSLRLMLMVDFPIRCNRSRAYGRDSCCCVIAAPEKHPPRSDISPQGPIFCHSCGPFSIMMEMGESCFELNLYYSAIHFRNITKPDTEQGIHHRLPAAKVLCLTALKRRPRPPSLARFGYAL